MEISREVTDFLPFENDYQSMTTGDSGPAIDSGLTFENGTDSLAVYGDLVVEKNEAGLKTLRELIFAFTSAAAAIEASLETNGPSTGAPEGVPIKHKAP